MHKYSVRRARFGWWLYDDQEQLLYFSCRFSTSTWRSVPTRSERKRRRRRRRWRRASGCSARRQESPARPPTQTSPSKTQRHCPCRHFPPFSSVTFWWIWNFHLASLVDPDLGFGAFLDPWIEILDKFFFGSHSYFWEFRTIFLGLKILKFFVHWV